MVLLGGWGPSLFLRGPSAPGALSSPPACLSLSRAGEGEGTLLGINFTLWILLLSCLFPQEKAQPWDPSFVPLSVIHLSWS